MHIEEILSSIDTTLKALLTSTLSVVQLSATLESTSTDDAETTKRKRRTKAEIAADEAAEAAAKAEIAADEAAEAAAKAAPKETTRYWVSESLGQVYAELPGSPQPSDQSFKIESEAHYNAKKAEFEAKKAASTAAASSAPAATQAAAVATSASGSVSWDDVVTALKGLATNPAHGADAVVKIVKEFDAKATNVPALKALNKNAEIVAAVNALLNPVATEAADPLFG